MTFSNLAVHVIPIERALAGQGGDRTSDRVEQRADLRAIIDVSGGQFDRDNLAGVGVRSKMQFPPGPTRSRAIILDRPLAGPAQPQAGSVISRWMGWLLDAGRSTCRVSARRLSVVVRNGEIETERADDGSDQAFGLAQRQPEYGARGQCCPDRRPE